VNSVLVRYFAAARAAAGLPEERVDLSSAATVGELKAQLQSLHGQDLTRVLAVCSLLVDGTVARDDSVSLASATGVDVLPPFAGG
jgi:molybdopterin converting factor small subunit